MVIRTVEKIKSIGKKNREWVVGNAVILNRGVRKGLIEKGIYEQRPAKVRKQSGRHLRGESYRHWGKQVQRALSRSLPGWVLSPVRRPVWPEVPYWEVTAPARNSQNSHCQDGCLACILSYYFPDIYCFNFPTSLWLFSCWLIHWEQSPEYFFWLLFLS